MIAAKSNLKPAPIVLRALLATLLAMLLVWGLVPSAAAEPSPEAAVGPSVVTVEKMADGSFVYFVDGEPEFMTGMGYNAIYRFLSDEERAARYDADFAQLREAGYNTILGWDADKGYEQDKFDQLILDKAWEHGLGVVMPFYLPPEGDYTDPAFRDYLRWELTTKVEAYKNHPALRMWGVGNEVIEGVIPRGQIEVFGEFYLELADLVRELDPNHPVIYREAEEVFLPYLSWYTPADGVERPWLLYGMNMYTFRLDEVLDAWPSLGYDLPVFVTEFAPDGWSRPDRPFGYLTMWHMMRSHPDFVLGAAVYVWTTEGPEPVDQIFGVVDGDGNPVDGSLEALAPEMREASGGPILVRYEGD